MRFDAPHLLSLIPAALLGLLALYVWTRRRKARLMRRFGQIDLVRRLARSVSPARQTIKYILTASAIVCILFALARPQYGAVERPLQRRGVEVVVALDCSLSMRGRDIPPSRIDRAKTLLRDLVRQLQGDNVAILAFAGIPIVQCPMTADYDMALNLLDAIDTDTVPIQGTAIGDAVRKAIQTYRTAGRGYRVLVLLTDGEDHESKPLEAAREAAEAGVRIYPIGLGTPAGAPVPLPEGGFKESDGTKVNSRLDFDMLTKMANATGGKAILANPSGDLEAAALAADIRALKDIEFRTSTAVAYREQFWVFLALAAILLAIEMLIGESRRENGAPPAAGKAADR